MAFVLKDRVHEGTTVTGTGSATLLGAVAGFQTFGNVMSVGDTCWYAIVHAATSWETGIGTYSGTNTLARTTVIESSNSGALVSFAAGSKDVFMGLPASRAQIDTNGPFVPRNLSLAVSASGGALTITLNDGNGNAPSALSPVVIPFRNATLATGTPTVLSITAASTVVIPSTSTCGFASATAGRLWIIGWNDGGTFRLGVFNASNPTTIFPLAEYGLASSLQVVTAGNAAGQHYTAGAAVTTKAFRILGYVDWTSSGMTAGTWTTSNLNSITLFGPGIKKPGEIVQVATNSTATVGSATSVSFVALSTGQSQAITPTNAANAIRVFSQGSINATVNANVGLQQARGSILIGLPQVINIGGGGQSQNSSIISYDFPNSASAVTYQFQGKASSGTMQYPIASSGAVLELQEIMG